MFPNYLVNIQKHLFDPLQLKIENLIIEKESKNYNACSFQCNNRMVIFRTANNTPKKKGLFVTLWKRNKSGSIEPFHYQDSFDLTIIETIHKNKVGYFIFNKEILNEKGILFGKQKGKLGFRVYPRWDNPNNRQGIVTQKWQSPFFIETKDEMIVNHCLNFLSEIFIK
ncbi:MepB protein [Leptospira levettii]|uniref:MepB family protein n=1 Tax=Leptospira levettii TaxID=2023178 RepID=UPI000C2A4F8A|nr:MepB family protein [Leptospira levettii]MCW7475441.1 MepB family protein [Leptospira levettii]PJZ88724.1 MepB protein [Leptospira levettii]PJZ99669.1 MepB protein [Leptospira levettii]